VDAGLAHRRRVRLEMTRQYSLCGDLPRHSTMSDPEPPCCPLCRGSAEPGGCARTTLTSPGSTTAAAAQGSRACATRRRKFCEGGSTPRCREMTTSRCSSGADPALWHHKGHQRAGRAQATSYCETLAVLREFCGCSPA
jgi:hypothetical protein